MGRYELQLFDTPRDQAALTMSDCGGIYRGESWPGAAPSFLAYRGAGEWHELDIWFQAPRFDEGGTKVSNAMFRRVLMDDTLLHEDLEVPEPTLGASGPEVPEGPLVIQGDHSIVAIGDVRVRPMDFTPGAGETARESDWVSLFDGESLEGWRASDDGTWTVEDGVIVGQGKTSHLFSPRGDYQDFEVRGSFKISDNGNSGFYFRAAFGPGWPAGYEAQVNSTYADPQRTGSLYAIAPITAQLVPPDTWFDYHVTCRDEAAGTHVVIRVNGVVVNDVVDAERRHARGHIAIQQHHEGSRIEVKELFVKEL
jgi:hypothetical protein